jgi:hypothetical protein
MAKENTSRQKQASGTSQPPTPTDTTQNGYTGTTSSGTSSTGSSKSTPTRPKNKGNQTQVGGTALPGAKSTQPKQISNTNNPQKQEMESYNRTMRRRMEHLGTGSRSADPAKAVRNRRQERLERIKERQKAQVASVKRSLPGGKVSTDTSRVYYLIGGVAAAIVLLIIVFVILRVTGVLH